MRRLPHFSSNNVLVGRGHITSISNPHPTPPPLLFRHSTPPPASKGFLVDLSLSAKAAVARLRLDPLFMQEVPEEDQLRLLTFLLEEETEKTNIFDLLVAAVCVGPEGMIKFIEYLARDPHLRAVAANYHCSELVSRLPHDLVRTILRSPEVLRAIEIFQDSLSRPQFQLGPPIEE